MVINFLGESTHRPPCGAFVKTGGNIGKDIKNSLLPFPEPRYKCCILTPLSSLCCKMLCDHQQVKACMKTKWGSVGGKTLVHLPTKPAPWKGESGK